SARPAGSPAARRAAARPGRETRECSSTSSRPPPQTRYHPVVRATRSGSVVAAMAALACASCYATHERGVAAANARDWPAAEKELWRYLQGGDCVGHQPLLACKQAAVELGEV